MLRKVQVLLSAVMIARFEIECFEHPEMSSAEMREKMDHYASLSSHYQDEFTEQMNEAMKNGKLDIFMDRYRENVSNYLD